MAKLREIKPRMVIHCRTREEANILCDHLDYYGLNWKNWWDTYKEDTCYEVGKKALANIGSVSYYEKLYRTIIEFSDLIIPELSAEEVLKIRNELSHDFVREYLGLGYGLGLDEMLRKATISQVMDMCEQWKVDHERKEPEFEWVDVCRIIEVQDNGVKKCVHEADIKDADLPFGYKECTAEMILKEYMRIHRGNYFAVVERVCRVKGS